MGKGINPWKENDPTELVDWIDQKEQLWEKIEGRAFAPLPLFPQLRRAVDKFASDPDWNGIETARQQGFLTARQYARDLIAISCSAQDKRHRDQVAEKIYKALVQPLIE